MKTKLLFITIVATALLLTACSSEDSFGEEWDGRLHLSSSVVTLTRATHNLDQQIGNGEKVWLYIDNASDNTLANKVELTADGSGNFTGDDNLFFPAKESSINLYAFHINNSSVTTIPDTYPVTGQTHKVEQDQKSTSSGSGYAKSDLLYVKATKTKEEVKTDNGAIALEFKHCLSKIEVILKKGKGMDAINISDVKILNTQLEGTFTPSKDSNDGLTVIASGSTGENAIEIDNGITESSGDVLNEAIIIPQTLNSGGSTVGGVDFIRVTLSTGGTLSYKLTSETQFDKNTKYTYTITANLTGLEVTSTVANWETGTGDSGNATM